MKRFELHYKDEKGSWNVSTELELEMLLKRYGLRIVNNWITESPVYPAFGWDYQDEGSDYVEPTIKTYLYEIEYDEEKVSSEDVEEFWHFVHTLYGRLVTFIAKN